MTHIRPLHRCRLVALIGAVVCIGTPTGCAKNSGPGSTATRSFPPAGGIEKPTLQDVARLGVPVYPGSRISSAAGIVTAPVPEGIACTFSLRISRDGPAAHLQRNILKYYKTRLRRSKYDRDKNPTAVVGQTREGNETTVLVDSRTILLKQPKSNETRRREYAEIIITVRLSHPVSGSMIPGQGGIG